MEKDRLPTVFVNITQYLINYKSYPELFRLLSSIHRIEDKYSIYPMLAGVYPELAEVFNNLRGDCRLEDMLNGIKFTDIEEEHLWRTMLWLNSEFINLIGCECGKKVFLFSDTNEQNYNHHYHLVFRKWAYAHYSEKRREMLIIPVE